MRFTPMGPAILCWVGLVLAGCSSREEGMTVRQQRRAAWTPLAVTQDPLVRMPGTQPGGGGTLEAPSKCSACHAGYNPTVEPGHGWQGSMMAQASRDFLFWSCFVVSGQDSIWALGRPNAMDLCERCHFPKGWLENRSDPPNASLMTGADYDGVQCDLCHNMYDPHFEDTYAGLREGSDWTGYWDETGASSTPSAPAAAATRLEDIAQAATVGLFNGGAFFAGNRPLSAAYTEAGSGQLFVSATGKKRASFADAGAKHQMHYSRFHKSRTFCASCHDVSNPALANLAFKDLLPGQGSTVLPSESSAAASYYHVERTFSEFRLSAYGQQGGADGIGPFAPANFATSSPGSKIARCQDCHMRDVSGVGCNKTSGVNRPTASVEHPQSGLPLHDLTGGNIWVSWVLASTVATAANHDATNAALLGQGPAVLTLDLTQGEGINAAALLDGVARAEQQLKLAAAVEDLTYTAGTGALSFRLQNQTGHKLLSGFPEGRRMFVNVKLYQGTNLIHEVNPYDTAAGTLRGLDPVVSPASPPLGAGEVHRDDLVYEMHPASTVTGEPKTLHFVLATGRHKDNRIPPQGFDIAAAPARQAEPVVGGAAAPGLYTAQEYAGGYDAVALTVPAGADQVTVSVYYQVTSREYIEFLRDEIKGTGAITLPAAAYIIQTDPFFAGLRAWGDTIWQLWQHNKDVPGAAPFLMAQASTAGGGCTPPVPSLLTLAPESGQVTVTWSDVHGGDPGVLGYRLYYDQSGKSQLVAQVGTVTVFTDGSLTNGQTYCFKVTARYAGCESLPSNVKCATPVKKTGDSCLAGVECASGSCVDDRCCNSTCGGGGTTDCQACSLAAGAAQDGQCGPVAATTVCRAAAGACDVAEACNGVHLTCPEDGFQLDGTACAGGTGTCQLGSCVPLTDAGVPTPDQSVAKPDQSVPTADQSTPTADQSTPAADQATPAADQATPVADQATPTSDQGPPQADQLVLPDLPRLDSVWPADRSLTDGTARDAATDAPRPGADRGSAAGDAGVRTDRGMVSDPGEGCSCGLGAAGAPPLWPALLLLVLARGRRCRRLSGR